ncbi:hypothetical protein NQ317_007719 [Molorchus minor]|uniref:Uncharacterized protein n=1 Tax=Molorchus minor TaxID=1323400 RepID=A0ABQ9IQ63_9CUCU|nr:hypothetical protein NQ317_007719 [Molorchus minor]
MFKVKVLVSGVNIYNLIRNRRTYPYVLPVNKALDWTTLSLTTPKRTSVPRYLSWNLLAQEEFTQVLIRDSSFRDRDPDFGVNDKNVGIFGINPEKSRILALLLFWVI